MVKQSVLLSIGWKEAVDSSGQIYFYNKQLRKSQYQLPQDDSPPLPPPTQGALHRHFTFSPMRTPYSFGPSCAPPALGGQASSYRVVQLRREHARLRGMLAYVTGTQKAEIYGDLAAIESELFMEN